MDDEFISSKDLQFDNALRLSNQCDSMPGTPGSRRLNCGKAEVVEGASHCAAVRVSNSADGGSITKCANEDDNSLTLNDLKFNTPCRCRASMEWFDKDLKFDNDRHLKNEHAHVPNIGHCIYDTDQDSDDSITNEDLQFNNIRQRASAYMPDISSMFDSMDGSGCSTNSSSIMAEHIVLKLKVAELQSELHQAQSSLRTCRTYTASLRTYTSSIVHVLIEDVHIINCTRPH